ncbi:MAG: EAL domain-containing protein [Cyanobacteria bacterium P01_H01_bin.35]
MHFTRAALTLSKLATRLKSTRKNLNISSMLPTQLALLLGISVSIMVAWRVNEIEQSQQRDRFSRKADNLGFVLQQSFDNASLVTKAISGLFSSMDTITAEQFAQFSTYLLPNSPGILSVGFAEYVPHAQRLEFEARLGQRGAKYPFIWQGSHNPVPQLEEYIVTTYIEPFDQRQDLLGYNHRGDWQRSWAIDRARQGQVMSTTNQVQLPKSGYLATKGFVVYQPIYQNNEQDEAEFVGVVYSTFNVEDVIIAAIRDLDWLNVSFYLYDLDIDRLDSALIKNLKSLDDRLAIAYHSDSQAIVTNPDAPEIVKINHHVIAQGCPYGQDWTACIRTLNLGWSEWSVVLLPPQPSVHHSVWNTLLIGLLLTLTLTLYLWMLCKRAQQNEKLVQAIREARTDPLTGLANRREFEHQLKAAISIPSKPAYCHALCCMDLDRFKIVNDICGHEAGDRLLCEVSQLLHQHIRKTDVLARMGGDEFSLLLYHCSLSEAQDVTKKILTAITEFQFKWQQKIFHIGISIGLTEVTPQATDEAELMRQADKLCYIAKQDGRNQIVTFDPDNHQAKTQTSGIVWLSWLNDGLIDDFLQLYCQPTLALKPNSKHNYVEILLRLRDRSDISISVYDFIQDAERYQLMPTIDRWVIQTFLHYLSNWNSATNIVSLQPANIYAINLSASTLSDETFLDFCQAQFQTYQIPAKTICFEITESVAIANVHKTKQLISKLQHLGCTFALDDFGKGMSSFAYLRDLPIDYLKVDGSFIVNLEGDSTGYDIVNAITQIGRILNVKTIAEFVENSTLLNKVRQLDFDYAQGYEVTYPMPLEQHLSFKNLEFRI